MVADRSGDDRGRAGAASVVEQIVSLSPGVELADALAGVDRRSLNGYQRVEVLAAGARQLAHDQAQLLPASRTRPDRARRAVEAATGEASA